MFRAFNWVSRALVSQGQSGEYAGKNDDNRYETSEDGLGLREDLSFGVCVAVMADVGNGGGFGGEYADGWKEKIG